MQVAKPLAEHVREILLHNMRRVIDTFHEWDTDGSKTISYDEFCKAMSGLGLTVTSDVAAAWQHFDSDGSGEIVYHELLEAIKPRLAPSDPSIETLDPNNKRGAWRYTRSDWQDASDLIERNFTRDVPYSEDLRMHKADVDGYFLKGYLRSDAPVVTKHVPKAHAVGKLPGLQLDSNKSSGFLEVREQLREAMGQMALARVIDVFHGWDTDDNGSISRREFGKAMATLGLNVEADYMLELFNSFDTDGSGAISYHELEKVLGKARGRQTRQSPSSKKGLSRKSKGVGQAEQLAERLRNALLGGMKRIIDTFHEWDADHSQTISYDEFCKAMATLNVVPSSQVAAAWKLLDSDGSGEIVYHELLEALNPRLAPAKPSVATLDPNNNRKDWRYNRHDYSHAAGAIERPTTLRDVPYSEQVGVHQADIDSYMLEHGRDATVEKYVPKEHRRGTLSGMELSSASASDTSAVHEQLREAMARMATTRVIDVLRAWDTDENGTISYREFAGAMTALGLSATAAEMRALFAEFDADGSGKIDYAELRGALERKKPQQS